MITKIQYYEETERKTIITNNSDKSLVKEEYITEGNFLYFDDNIVPTNAKMQETIDNQYTLMNVLATMHEEMILKGTV